MFNSFNHGHDTVGTSAKVLSPIAYEVKSFVRIKADAANSNDVFVGANAGVTSANGYRLDAGESVDLPLATTDLIFVIGGASAQGYSFVVF